MKILSTFSYNNWIIYLLQYIKPSYVEKNLFLSSVLTEVALNLMNNTIWEFFSTEIPFPSFTHFQIWIELEEDVGNQKKFASLSTRMWIKCSQLKSLSYEFGLRVKKMCDFFQNGEKCCSSIYLVVVGFVHLICVAININFGNVAFHSQ